MNFDEIKVKEKKVMSFKVSEETSEKWHKLLAYTGTKSSKTFEFVVSKIFADMAKEAG